MMNLDYRITKWFFDFGRSNPKTWSFITLRGMYVYFVVYLLIWPSLEPGFFIALSPFFAVAITFIIAMLVRYVVRRKRPAFDGATYHAWLNSFSFPSLHAALSFALSTSISILILGVWPDILGLIAITLLTLSAAIISLSRLIVGVHYASDIIVGSLLGIAVSVMLLGL